MAEEREVTNAEYIYILSNIQWHLTRALANVADGMWNPKFCAADADTTKLSEIEAVIDHYRKGGYRPRPTPGDQDV